MSIDADSAPPGTPAPLALAELAAALRAGLGCLDVRPAEAFVAGHLRAAASLPWDELPQRRHELPPRGRAFVVVGADPGASHAAADWLRARGWSRARPLAEPLGDWPGPWEQGAASAVLWEPSALVLRWAPRLPPGAVLDLGCGAGRDAVYLARQGRRVVAVDRLPDALARAADLARRQGVGLELVEADLRRALPDLRPGPSPAPRAPTDSLPSSFSTVLMIRFVAPQLRGWIAERLAPGGLLLLEALAPEELERGRLRRPSRALSAEAARGAFPGWTVLEEVTEAGDEPILLTRLVLRRE